MVESSPKLVNVMYDLNLWQVRAIKSGSLEGFLVPTSSLIEKKGSYNDCILLCLREPFYSTGGGHGEQGSFLYQADGKVKVPSYGLEKTTRKLGPDDWFSASGMHPLQVRFFMKVWSPPPSDNPIKMALKYSSQLGLRHRGRGRLIDQIYSFWKEKYRKDYLQEEAVSFLEGEIVGPYKRK